jgi:Protein of unknown function (DUF1553)/Protein of unknown function (DUF1549)/Concanavalin A-like lectin/glucanases superfamily/Planctomycete cytochrome C
MKRYACLLLLAFSTIASAQTPRPIQFNRDVRPILSDVCFQCHGPDKAKRKAKLGFDTEEGARVDLGGYHAIVSGKPDESELIKRITSSDKSKRMPPPSAAVTLTPQQIDTLTRWIKEGAKWEKHLAFIAPERPALPSVKNKFWPKNGIDYFVLARLEQEGITPSPEADAITLIRRMSLDLTGLPPTPAEVDEFVKAWDTAGAKREALLGQLADRLLASPRYGERMAQRWLDGARYADTNGYQNDGERTMWRWRDWVIEAFNDNMPFDRFTIEQIAGDLLPKPTLEQKIATGFNRNHRGNSEGGVIPEEYAVEYVVDRVDTTSTVWLGLTAGCARCHSHKYDPITQKEFYQLFAYFNNVPERGKAIKYGNSPPYIKSPTRAQAKKLLELQRRLKKAQDAFAAIQPDIEMREKRFEFLREMWIGTDDWAYTRYQVAHFPLDDLDAKTPQAKNGKPRLVEGRIGKAVHLDGDSWLDAGDVGAFGFFDKFSMGAWIKPANGDGGAILSRMVDTDRADGYNLLLSGGKIHVQLVKRWLDDAIRVETEDAIRPGEWHHVLFTYDGSRLANGIKIYVDGRPAKVKVNLDDLNQNFNTKEPFRIGAGGGSRFRGAIDDVRIYDDVIAPADSAAVANVDWIRTIVTTPAVKRTPAQQRKLRLFILETHLGTQSAVYEQLLRAGKDLEKYDATIPTTMVMEEMSPPRDTNILLRGEYDKKGPKVLPSVPAAFPPLPKGTPSNRLGFANWLVASDNPLTARVAVNRHWQMLFGAGIVRSVEDFGAQGDWPSHPELLDWLAVEYFSPDTSPERKRAGPTSPALALGAGWDTKRLLKTIVTSATYRQSSRVTPALLQKDPDNRLLARGPRFRLSADMIRDQALFVSSLLVEQRGGPSVRPYQPTGLAKELTGTEDYVQDHGPSLYRRSLYTFWKRTIAPPTLMTFDAANRETCVVRETRTNTPLQALNLMNDVTFVEAARVLAERVMKAEKTPDPRLALAFRLAAARSPNPAELKILRTAFERHHAHYRADPSAALKLIRTGEAPRDRQLDDAEHAAYAAVCNLILNLDEVITKE